MAYLLESITLIISGYSIAHDYSMQAVGFTADSTKMISIDTGHGGTYQV